MGSPTAGHSKANRKVCFILDASNGGLGGEGGFYRQGEGDAETAVWSDGHHEIGDQWSDQYHLDCFKYSLSLVLGSVCSHFLEAISKNCGSGCRGYSLVIM